MDITKMPLSGKTRKEHDLLGELEIPEEYYFGVQTMRALDNFHISRVRLCMYPYFIKALANVGAYTEGFAVYAQYESLKYLDGISQEVLDVYREYELLTYCLVIAADIGIHYEGWSLNEFENYFTEMGLSIGSGDALYAQLQANPAVFETYYVGYHEIMDLREKAEDALGENFDAKAFNEALLESGTAPFNVVERHIDAYIENAS